MKSNRTSVVIIGLVALTLFTSAIVFGAFYVQNKPYVMPVSTMEPTITKGQQIRADLTAYDDADPSRWEVVVFQSPKQPEHDWVYRIVGMPGETIDFADESGALLIDGKEVEVPKHLNSLKYFGLTGGQSEIVLPYTIPQASYFVLGDNPKVAIDSRAWGALDRDAIRGRVHPEGDEK